MYKMVKEKTKYKTIENFLQEYYSKYTQKAYRTQLYKFFDVLETNPDEYFNDKKDNTSYELDVKKFINETLDFAKEIMGEDGDVLEIINKIESDAGPTLLTDPKIGGQNGEN